jgi:hypothetical protein
LSGLQTLSPLDFFKARITDYLAQNQPATTYEQMIGTRTVPRAAFYYEAKTGKVHTMNAEWNNRSNGQRARKIARHPRKLLTARRGSLDLAPRTVPKHARERDRLGSFASLARNRLRS